MITPERARQMLLTAGADGFTAPETLVTLELATQAPVMAEQIANQHYEYDYEVVFGDEWTPQGYEFVTLEDAQRRVAERRRRTPARIIRRLVTEWEVVE